MPNNVPFELYYLVDLEVFPFFVHLFIFIEDPTTTLTPKLRYCDEG